MIDFQRVPLEGKERIQNCLLQTHRGCAYSFVNLFLWGKQRVAFVKDRLVIFSRYGGRSSYHYPIGTSPLAPVLEAMLEDARQRGIPFCLTAISPQDCRELEALYPGKFRFIPDRNSADYIYEIDHLAELKGKKFQQKRNHINRFLEENPQWSTAPISCQTLPQCQTLLDKWYAQRPEEDFSVEQIALSRVMDHWEQLPMEGLILYTQEEPIAFTMGSRLNYDTFDVHFEKAFAEIQGAYPMINRQFARHLRDAYPEIRYLDREEDMGLPGLRKAKSSYHPDILLELYRAEIAQEENSPPFAAE